MAVNEKNVLMQKKKSNGDKDILYPVTKIENVVGLKENLLRCKTITLGVANWVQNTSTKNYEYTVTDNTITANHKVEGRTDLANRTKLKDNEINSFDGGFKIITKQKPTEAVTVNFYIQKVGG